MRPPALLKVKNVVTGWPESRTAVSAAMLAAGDAEDAVAADLTAEM